MRIGVPRERLANEARVAATPKTVEQLLKLGFTVAIESGAGHLASFDDAAYQEAGAIITDTTDVWQSDLILKVNAPFEDEIALMREGSTLVSLFGPLRTLSCCKTGRASSYCISDGFSAAYLPCAIHGCPQLHGKYCRLPCHC